MYIKNKIISAVYKLIIAALILYALEVQIGLLTGAPKWGALDYFTNLSNLLAAAYFLAAAVFSLCTVKNTAKTTLWPQFKGIVMMALITTMLVAHFLLGGFTMGTSSAMIFILHYVAPIMTVLDWLLFDRKGQMTGFSPILWTSAPLLYLAYALLMANYGPGLGTGKYPYPFMDADLYGAKQVAITLLVMFAAFVVLGYVIVLIDRLMAGKKKEKAGTVQGR